MRKKHFFASAILLLLTNLTIAFSQWPTTTDKSLLVSPWGVAFDACSDSAGGAYVVLTNISTIKNRFYLQRIRHDGSLQWQDPIMLSDTAILQKPCLVINDGFGNAVTILIAKTPYDTIGTKVFYTGKVFVQKVDVKGNKLWGANGIRVSLDTNDQYGFRDPIIVPDDSGGVFAMWQNKPRGIDQPVTDIYVQHISNDGKREFGDSAKLIASVTLLYLLPGFIAANSSAIISFGSDTNSTLKRIDHNGNILWSTDFPHWISNVTQINNHSFLAIAEKRSDDKSYITSYIAYSLDIKTGQCIWQNEFADGIHIPAGGSVSAIVSVLTRQDSNVAIIYSVGTNTGYIQLMSLAGKSLFGKNGKTITDTITGAYSFSIASVNSKNNSVMILFSDTQDNRYYKYYTQQIDADGELLWTSKGYLFSDEFIGSAPIIYFKTIQDGFNGMIAIGYCEPYHKIMAKQISSVGIIGDITTSAPTVNTTQLPQTIGLLQNYPNPFNPVTVIKYQIPPNLLGQKDHGASTPMGIYVTLKVFDILGKEVGTLVDGVKEAGNYSVDFDASRLSSGIYFYEIQAGKFNDTKKMLFVK